MPRYRNGLIRSTPPAITGIEVTRQKRTKKERAKLAASIISGRTALGSLTQAQVARMCGVSAAYVQAQRAPHRVPVQLAAE